MNDLIKERVFECVEAFSVDKYESNDSMDVEGQIEIPKKSIWYLSEQSYLSEVRLESEELGWLEIDNQTLKTNFIEIKE